MQLHIARNGARSGPFDDEQVRSMLAGKLLSPDDLAWHPGASGWLPLHKVLADIPPPVPNEPPSGASSVPQSATGTWRGRSEHGGSPETNGGNSASAGKTMHSPADVGRPTAGIVVAIVLGLVGLVWGGAIVFRDFYGELSAARIQLYKYFPDLRTIGVLASSIGFLANTTLLIGALLSWFGHPHGNRTVRITSAIMLGVVVLAVCASLGAVTGSRHWSSLGPVVQGEVIGGMLGAGIAGVFQSGLILYLFRKSQAPDRPVGDASTELKGVGGWLLFFCVLITIILPVGWGLASYANWIKISWLFKTASALRDVFWFETVLYGAAAVYGAFAGWWIWSGDPRGKRNAIEFLIGRFAVISFSNVGAVLMSSGIPWTAVLTTWLGNAALTVVWLLYFVKSKRVRNTYGTGAADAQTRVESGVPVEPFASVQTKAMDTPITSNAVEPSVPSGGKNEWENHGSWWYPFVGAVVVLALIGGFIYFGRDTSDLSVAQEPVFKSAKAAEEKEDFDKMLTAAKALVEQHPKSALAFKTLSDAHYYKGDFVEAMSAANRAVAINRKDIVVWHDLGMIYLGMERLNDAEAALREGLKVSEGEPLLLADLGSVHLGQDRAEEARKATSRAKELLDSTHFDNHNGEVRESSVWSAAGNNFLTLGNAPSAQAAFEHVTKLDPSKGYGWTGLGKAYLDQHKKDEAIAAFRKATELEPSNGYACGELGNALYEKETEWNDLDKPMPKVSGDTIEVLKKATILNPKDAGAWSSLGTAYDNLSFGSADARRAHATAAALWLKFWQKAVESRPDDFKAWKSLGKTQSENGNRQEAIAAIKKAVAIKPNDAEGWILLGHAYLVQGDIVSATVGKAKYTKSTDAENAYMRAGSTKGQLALANYFEGIGNQGSAVAILESIVSKQPDEYSGWLALSSLYQEQGRLLDELRSLREMVRLHPLEPSNRFILGSRLWRNGILDEAIVVFEKIVALDGTNFFGVLQLACAYELVGRNADAKRVYADAMHLKPKEFAVTASEVLRGLRAKLPPNLRARK